MQDSAARLALRTALGCVDVASHADGAQLWSARLERLDGSRLNELAALLDDAEQSQAARYRFEVDRRSYVLAHALRRAAIVVSLGLRPDEIRFGHSDKGQPLLLAARKDGPFYFSHSRCRRAVAVAVAPFAVGVDIEVVDADVPNRELLAAFVADGGSQDFISSWTTLEAFWKAAGTGLDSSNPRICCNSRAGEGTRISLEGNAEVQVGHGVAIASQPGCVISVVRAELSLIHKKPVLQFA